MEKPRKPSINNQLFEKEVKRLQRLVKIAEKKGIVFIRSPIPQKPDKITRKKLTEISTITATDIQSKGYTVDTETGELTPYKPPKQSKPRRVSTSTYPIDINSPHIPTAKIQQPLTPEELHQIRSEAAKKAAVTRAKREAEDPAYRSHMQEIRRRNLEKARKAQKEFAEKYPEEAARRRSEAARRAAETRRKKREESEELGIPKKPKKKLTDNKSETPQPEQTEAPKPEQPEPTIPEETQPPTPEIPDDYDEILEPYDELPKRGYEILNNIKDILNRGLNENLCEYILNLINEIIDDEGIDVVIDRIENYYDIIEKVQIVAYGSGKDEKQEVRQSAVAVASIIYGGVLGAFALTDLEEAYEKDFPITFDKSRL